MSKHADGEAIHLENVAVQLDNRWEAIRRDAASPKPEPAPTPGALARPTPEWAFKPIKEQSSDEELLEGIVGLTLNGPRVPAPEPERALGEALHAIVELREGIARCEGERQARLQSTRDAIAGRQAKIEARRTAILGLCKENGWRLDMYALAGRLTKRLVKDRRFRDKDGKLRFPVSRRSITDDLTFLATTSLSPSE
jgi:hypothetical protein